MASEYHSRNAGSVAVISSQELEAAVPQSQIPGSVDVQVAGGTPVLFDAVQFRDVEDFQSVTADTYDLEVALDSNGAVALSLPNTTLPDGAIITVFAVGLAGDSSLDALVDVQ